VLVDTMMVLMQVGRDGDWTDRGVPEVVTGYDRGPGPIAAAGPGPWYLADRIEPDCAAARINGRAVLTRGGRDIITFRTNIGEIGGISSGVTVIPVDED
jgi:hypothetical protein